MKTLLKGLTLLAPMLAATVATALPAAAGAQEYPARLVTIVVPFTPGASNDAIGRYLADSLGKLWKQTLVVDNRPGAGSAIGSAYAARQPGDGYTLLIGSSTYTTNAATRNDLGFDPMKDLKAISMVGRGQIVAVVGTRVPMNTLADLVKQAKAQTIFYATAGVGSSQHFNAELLAEALAVPLTAVPYRGATEGLNDLFAGRTDLLVGGVGGVLPFIQQGKVKPIAVLSKTRSPSLPNVPTTVELGFPAAVTQNYWAVLVPPATPDAVVRKINESVHSVTNTPEGRQFLAKIDGEPVETMSADEVSAYVKKEIEYWTRLAKRLKISQT